MRLALLLCLVVLQDDLSKLVEHLGSDDPETRDAAAAKLLAKGEEARPALDKAAASGDAEVKARAKALLAHLDRRLIAAKVKIEIVLPERAPTRYEVNAGVFTFTVRVTNTNETEVVVPLKFDLKVLDKDGKDVPPEYFTGWGIGTSGGGCQLPGYARETFKTVAAKQTVEFVSRLDAVANELDGGSWRLAAGEFTLAVTPSYSRESFMSHCGRNCACHKDETQPWNRSVVLREGAKKALKVEPGPSAGCEAHAKEFGADAIEHSSWHHLAGGKCASCGKGVESGCRVEHKTAAAEAKLCYRCAGAKGGACAICGK